ncbi:serine/threonine-protein kinase [Actinoplanes lutulentus]|uniref:non-specific serine/threonine protein kinase n=1 Tax=Actinoplanes lutulentus TaxID=1287878 RepID=A0A327ZJF8_9ACTN|nr:serine/threonine-protein kinase [Actinoplanes lutulentus]MBB2945275.1 serine/threonine-protein kinase [Actinoplanes lutulentus]RAK40589.1 serine/threonine-protein kinase [Actinoplanes lutulentus]
MARTERNGQGEPLRIAGRYRLVEKLGTGGMSVVWRGYDETLGRDVAVKVLSPQLAEDRTFRDRLRQEALAAARLCHPHITGIHDFGEARISEELTVPFVVMELNDGESLGARIGRQGSLEWREAVTIAAEVASALATAHARGLVHRDVTPANVMLTGAGAKVVDFGISAIVGQRDAAPDGSLLGTPAYLAPERLAGVAVSPATDVYALGLLLYRALTGRMPWPAENTAEALRAHLYSDPEPIPDLPGMPAGVATMCLRCLAKDPAGRPGAAEIARVLSAIAGIRPVIPPVRSGDGPTVPCARGVVSIPAERTQRSWNGVKLKLRAGLKIRNALRLGGVRPLGGGLFLGGLFPHMQLRDTTPRNRMPAFAALATVVLLGSTALSWSAREESRDTEAAQATAAGAAGAVVGGAVVGSTPRGRCAVTYEVRTDSGADFEARLTVVTTAADSTRWRVEFRYPGTQRLAPVSKAVSQQGRRVVVSGKGRSKSVMLHGGYRGRNPLPLAFAVDGLPCRTEVLGSTNPGTVKNNSVSAETGSASESSNGKRKRMPSRRGAGSRKPAPAQEPAGRAPAPVSKRGAGFSLAL